MNQSLGNQRLLSDDEIRDALASGDLHALERLFDLLWYDLPSRFAPEIIAITGDLEPQVFERRARLLHVSLLAHHRQFYATGDVELRKVLQVFATQGRRYASKLATFSHPSDLLSAGTIAVISARLRGAYIESERIGAWVDQQVALRMSRDALPWGRTRLTFKPGWLSTQRGLTATLAGDLDSAVRLFTRAHTEAAPAPLGHFAGANAVANLALLAAYRGHLGLAGRWLTDLDTMGPVPDWIEHLTNMGAKIARAIVAIEEGDADRARSLLDEVGPPTQGIELWSFVAYAHASFDALFGDPRQGLARLEEARFSQGAIEVRPTTMVGELVLRSEAKLLLRTRNGHRVLALAHKHPDVQPLIQHVAWVHLLAGDHHRAIKTAAQTLHHAQPTSVSERISLHLVLAVAHLREGDDERAAQAFETAVHSRSSPAHIKPFLLVSSEELRRLAKLANVANPLAVTVVPAQPNLPRAVALINLTRREQAVLEALNEGSTAQQAADLFGVSITTVRSQIQSIYKKLGTSKRSQALARAQELGLLKGAGRRRT